MSFSFIVRQGIPPFLQQYHLHRKKQAVFLQFSTPAFFVQTKRRWVAALSCVRIGANEYDKRVLFHYCVFYHFDRRISRYHISFSKIKSLKSKNTRSKIVEISTVSGLAYIDSIFSASLRISAFNPSSVVSRIISRNL